MKKESSSLRIQPLLPRHRLQITLFFMLLAAALIVMVWNMANLNDALKISTMQYASDVSYQLTEDLASRIQSNKTELELIADSLPRLNGAQAEAEFLERKRKILDFDELLAIDLQTRTSSAQISEELLDKIIAALEGMEESAVISAEGQYLLFFTPVSDAQNSKVLVGIRNQQNIQNLIQPLSFNGRGLNCIVDSQGQVVISPADVQSFMQLDDLFQSETDNETVQAIREMENNIAKGISGAFEFTSADQRRLIMVYHSLKVNDWTLLTLVPSDLIAETAEEYVTRSFLILGVSFAVFVLLLINILYVVRRFGQRMKKLAFTDPLTGGMNAAAFQAEYLRCVAPARPSSFAVVLVNVRGFKWLNENYGITAADQILQTLYRLFIQHMKEEEFAARAEADHFFLCLKASSQKEVKQRLEEIVSTVETLSRKMNLQYRLRLQIGALMIDQPQLDVMRVQDRVRVACHLHQEQEEPVFFTEELLNAQKREQELSHQFEASVRDGDFFVVFQPKVDPMHQRLCGAEALVRWRHPKLGLIAPSDFIPLFEKDGNVCQLDLVVMEQVCRWLRHQLDLGKKPVPVSVNLSRVHFRNPHFLDEFRDLRIRYDLPAGLIELELTESICFDRQQRRLVQRTIEQMHTYGFRCSIDDFGVGFSSLALIREWEIDTIKLDRQFFEEISDIRAQEVIVSFIELAHKLRIQVVAEGIESGDQVEFLRRAGCDQIQGFVYSRPLTLSEFENWEVSPRWETGKELDFSGRPVIH